MRNTRPAGKGDAKGERNGARPKPYVRFGLTPLSFLRPVFTRHDIPVSSEWLRLLTRTKYLRETVEALVFSAAGFPASNWLHTRKLADRFPN